MVDKMLAELVGKVVRDEDDFDMKIIAIGRRFIKVQKWNEYFDRHKKEVRNGELSKEEFSEEYPIYYVNIQQLKWLKVI